MELKHLIFAMSFSYFPGGSGGGISGVGLVDVDFAFDTNGFSSLMVWHEANLGDVPPASRGSSYRIISRTAPASNRDGADVMRTTYAATYTSRDTDPILAAKDAIESHLLDRIPNTLSSDLEEALKTNSGCQEAYETQIVEPVSTAVVGLCRDRSLFDQIVGIGRVQAIGTWTIGKPLSHPKMQELINEGMLVGDVLIIPEEREDLRDIIRVLTR